MTYFHNEIDKKWQGKWDEGKVFHCKMDTKRPKYYALDMFPYPSGDGLHMGHLASYTPTDVVARYKRAKGFNVLHPIGYDAFGLPAEQYAIKTGVHPEQVTKKAISNFRKQLKSFGYSFDWSREITTCNPHYYKWTQFIFKILFKRKLAYQTEVPVNWCPALCTVLANEEVVDGKSERGGHEVIRKPMKQWMLKITDYSERLLKDLDEVDWPERTKQAQRNWIGKSVGALIHFSLIDKKKNLSFEVFTTRPDTLFGVTYVVLAPEHPLLSEVITREQKEEVTKYTEQCLRKSEVDRKVNQVKTGVFTGSFVKHPITGKPLPLWVSDYVLMDYGTGSVMAVPAHDERDFEFAKQFKLPIQQVIECEALPYEGDGMHIHSSYKDFSINNLKNKDSIELVIQYLQKKKLGQKKIQYKLRDWLFSRQRYWGEPFPIVYVPEGGVKAVPDEELPVELPPIVNYEPTEKGEPPLARQEYFVNYKKDKGKRETDTMPGSAASSWYFLRYLDPYNTDSPFSFESQKYWMPVDLYVGGSEHSVGHLLYCRFWHKVLYDEGLVSHKEPFKKLVHQGVIIGEDGHRMSKSRGNGVNPDQLREEYGADSIRVYMCFLGPFDKDKPWSSQGILGSRRFLERIWRLSQDSKGKQDPLNTKIEKKLHSTVKKVTNDIESLHFNTAISSLMILVNEIYKENIKHESLMKTISQLLMPFAPHIAEEIWQSLGGVGLVSLEKWPEYDEAKTISEEVSIGVQVNGKLKGSLVLSHSTTEEQALQKALDISGVKKTIEDKKIIKLIYKPGKILNIIIGLQ